MRSFVRDGGGKMKQKHTIPDYSLQGMMLVYFFFLSQEYRGVLEANWENRSICQSFVKNVLHCFASF